VEKSGGGKVWVGEGGGGPKLEWVLMEGAYESLLARNGIIFPIILELFQVMGPESVFGGRRGVAVCLFWRYIRGYIAWPATRRPPSQIILIR
jgi:hypothetical protein